MNTVQPIREVALIEDIKDYLLIKNRRDYIMFCMGIYSALRISDILKLKVRDVSNKEYLYMREKKTKKERRFPINDELKKEINKYIVGMKDYEYLFPSREKNKDNIHAPITRQQAWKILSEAGKKFGLQSIGTHTLRKTFGYHYYQQTKDIVTLQEIFKHSDASITKRYIGITQKMVEDAIRDFKYK